MAPGRAPESAYFCGPIGFSAWRFVIGFSYCSLLLILIVVFAGHVVFGNFFGGHFALIGVAGVFHAADYFCFVLLAFFRQFFHAFGVCLFPAGEALVIARLSAGAGAQTAAVGRYDGIGNLRACA